MTAAVTSAACVVAVVPVGARLPDPAEAEPLEQLRLVESGPLAAVVGTPPADRPWGRAEDLLAHDRLVSRLVRDGSPVLPLRFGTLLAEDADVASELLDSSREQLQADLEQVRGRVQYTVKVRWQQDAVLAEVVTEDPAIRRLRAAPQRSLDAKVRLGRLVVAALEQRRPAAADEVLAALGDHVAIRQHDPASPEEVLSAAFLVEHAQAAAFEQRVERLAERCSGRLRVRLLGPSAAYDFVGGR